MLTGTSELAIKFLIFLALEEDETPLPPRQIAESLDCSPSYLAKTAGSLVRAGILQSQRGVHGGVLLARSPSEITLREIVEACQGLLVGNYCREIDQHGQEVCSFHQAMQDLHYRTVEILSMWKLSDLLDCPARNREGDKKTQCKMFFAGCERFC